MTVDIDFSLTRSNADALAARVTTAAALATSLLAVDRLISLGYTGATRTLLAEYQSEVGDASALMHSVADAAEIADGTDWTSVLGEEWWSANGATLDRLNRSVRDSSGHRITDADVREYYERATGNGDGGDFADRFDPGAAGRAASTLEDIDPDNIDNYWNSLPKWLQDQIAATEPDTFVDTVLGRGLPVTPEQISAIAAHPEHQDAVTKFLDDGGVIVVDETTQTATERAIAGLSALTGPALLLFWQSLNPTMRSAVLASGSDVVDTLLDADAEFSPDELEQIAGVLDEQIDDGDVELSSVLVDPNGVKDKLAALANGGSIGSQVAVKLVDGSSVWIKLANFGSNTAGVLAVIGACSDEGSDACAAAATMFVVDFVGGKLLTPIGWAALKQVAKLALPYIQGPDVPTPPTDWGNGTPPGQLPYETSQGPVIEYESTRNGGNPNGTVTYGN